MKAKIEIAPIGYGLKDTVETGRVEVRPEGVTLHFIRGYDERTHRPMRYAVTMTPAVRTGSWTTDEDRGQLEQVQQKNREDGVIELTAIWVETGERQTFKALIYPDLVLPVTNPIP